MSGLSDSFGETKSTPQTNLSQTTELTTAPIIAGSNAFKHSFGFGSVTSSFNGPIVLSGEMSPMLTSSGQYPVKPIARKQPISTDRRPTVSDITALPLELPHIDGKQLKPTAFVLPLSMQKQETSTEGEKELKLKTQNKNGNCELTNTKGDVDMNHGNRDYEKNSINDLHKKHKFKSFHDFDDPKGDSTNSNSFDPTDNHKEHKFKPSFHNHNITNFDSPKGDTVMTHDYKKYQKMLEGCERKKLSDETYENLVSLIQENDDAARDLFFKSQHPQYASYAELYGLLYVIQVGPGIKKPPNVGLKFRSYKGGHYSSESRDTPVICKVKDIESNAITYRIYHFYCGNKKRKRAD